MDGVRIGREKIKTAILILLLAASVIQIGILWGDQSHSLPFSFLLGIFSYSSSENSANDENAREELFVPYRLIASDGTEEHWIISRQNDLYDKLWNNAKRVLKSIAGKAPANSDTRQEAWESIVSKKGFMFEFKDNFDNNLVSWFLGIQEAAPAIRKVMIAPDGIDDRTIEVYIYSLDNGNIYRAERYLADRELWTFDKEENNRLFAAFNEDTKYAMCNYSLFGELKLDKVALPDVPIAVKSPKYRPFNTISSNTPEAVMNIGGENADEELANIILGNKKESYNRESFSDSAQFKNSDSIYTIYRNGLLEYKYIRDRGSVNRGDANTALMNAYKFMRSIRRLSDTKAELYLSEVKENKPGRYTFKFDYLFNGNPVFFNISLDNGYTKINNAVTIEADSERVLSCTWMLKDFHQTSVNNQYNVYFMDIANNQANGEVLKNTFINDLNIGYVITSEGNVKIEPSIVVEKSGSGIIAIKMPEKGD